MNWNRNKKRVLSTLIIGVLGMGLIGCGKKRVLDPSNPVQVTVWNYYSGYQQMAFDELVSEFNETVGAEKGIILNCVALGSIDGLVEELNNAVDGKVGAQEVPDIVCIYSNTAQSLEEKGWLLSLDSYFTEQEKNAFVPSFLEEGHLTEGGDLKIIPISKSTELLVYNKTDFLRFQEAANVTLEDMKTIEGIVELSQKYYEWTDSLTPDIPEDGKAFYGRDAIENYVINGSAQLGTELFVVDQEGKGTVNLDKETFRKLWDCYYVPFINGYFTASGRFRSDDLKVGKIVAATGSSSGVDFYPSSVTLEDDTTYAIEIDVMVAPSFENGNKKHPQQGAGYSVIHSSDEKKQYASVEFLKWMTKEEQNMQFAIGANYMPVTKNTLNEKALQEAFSKEENKEMSEILKKSLLLCAKMVEADELWVGKPFQYSGELRSYFGAALQQTAIQDRETVQEQIEAGSTREEAVKPFLSDEYFNQWFEKLQAGVEQILKS